jgi:hypothetical protein
VANPGRIQVQLPPTPGTGWSSMSNQEVPPAGPNGPIAEAKVTPAYRFTSDSGNHPARTGGDPWLAGSEGEFVEHGSEVGIDHRGHADLTDGDVRVLQAVSGQHADHGRRRSDTIGQAVGEEARH